MAISSGEPTKLLRVSQSEFAPYIPQEHVSTVGVIKAMIMIAEVGASLIIPGALATGAIALSAVTATTIVDATMGEISTANTIMGFGFALVPFLTFIKQELRFLPFSRYGEEVLVDVSDFERANQSLDTILKQAFNEVRQDSPFDKYFIKSLDPTRVNEYGVQGAQQFELKRYIKQLRKELQQEWDESVHGALEIPGLEDPELKRQYFQDSRERIKRIIDRYTEGIERSRFAQFDKFGKPKLIRQDLERDQRSLLNEAFKTKENRALFNKGASADQQTLLDEALGQLGDSELSSADLKALFEVDLDSALASTLKHTREAHPEQEHAVVEAFKEEHDRFNLYKIGKTRKDANGNVTYRFNPLSRRWWASTEGSNFTQLAQLANPTDLAREFVQTPYRIITSFFNKERGLLDTKGFRWLGKLTKFYTRSTRALAKEMNGRLIIVNSQWIAGYRVFRTGPGMFLLMVFFKTQMNKPRVIRVTTKQLEQWVRAPSKGTYYKQRFALSKNGKDITGDASIAAFLFPLGPARNFFSVASNTMGLFEKDKKSWTERFSSALERNFKTRLGRMIGMGFGGSLGAKVGTAVSKTITMKRQGRSTRAIRNQFITSTIKTSILRQSNYNSAMSSVRRNRNRYRIYRRVGSSTTKFVKMTT